MAQIRKPFQGVLNIIRFNWHFYLLSFGLSLFILFFNNMLDESYRIFAFVVCLLIIGTTITSLLVSVYVYDLSDLYQLGWSDELKLDSQSKIVNINAGFDETSSLLSIKYPNADLHVFDFYDLSKHTEVSIKRARIAYPPYPNTIQVSTSGLPLPDNYADAVFLILSAHEIRSEAERYIFFQELKRVTKSSGKIFITEHLRDIPNFLAYNIGFFHFISKSSWEKTFKVNNLNICREMKTTPFITTFILEKNGDSS